MTPYALVNLVGVSAVVAYALWYWDMDRRARRRFYRLRRDAFGSLDHLTREQKIALARELAHESRTEAEIAQFMFDTADRISRSSKRLRDRSEYIATSVWPGFTGEDKP